MKCKEVLTIGMRDLGQNDSMCFVEVIATWMTPTKVCLIHVEYILMLMQWYLLQIIVCQLSIGDYLGYIDTTISRCR